MYKQLIELKKQTKADQERLINEINDLQALASQSNVIQFDELAAASRITEARQNDHINGTKTAEKISKSVDKERAERVKNNASIANKSRDAMEVLAIKEAQLSAVNNELNSLSWKIGELVKGDAVKRLVEKKQQYHRIAAELLKALIDIDALNAVISDNPQDQPAKYVFCVESLPAIDASLQGDVAPWSLQASGEKLIFTRDAAFKVVHNTHLAITEEIKEALYGK